jgi:hypothetical protein
MAVAWVGYVELSSRVNLKDRSVLIMEISFDYPTVNNL